MLSPFRFSNLKILMNESQNILAKINLIELCLFEF